MCSCTQHPQNVVQSGSPEHGTPEHGTPDRKLTTCPGRTTAICCWPASAFGVQVCDCRIISTCRHLSEWYMSLACINVSLGFHVQIFVAVLACRVV